MNNNTEGPDVFMSVFFFVSLFAFTTSIRVATAVAFVEAEGKETAGRRRKE